MPAIVFLAGELKGQRITLIEGQQMLIGRETSCSITLTHGNVSRKHALLICQRGTLRIEDLQSTNGIHVNHQLVGNRKLENDDVVAIGISVFRVEIEDQDSFSKMWELDEEGVHTIYETEEDSAALPQFERHEEYQKLFDCMIQIQNILGTEKNDRLERCLGALFSVLPLTRIGLVMVNQNTLETRAAQTPDGPCHTPLSHSFAKRVIQAGQAILMDDVQASHEGDPGQTLIQQGVRTVLGVPLRLGEKTIGVLLGDNVEASHQIQPLHIKVMEFTGRTLELLFRREALRQLEKKHLRLDSSLQLARRVQEQIIRDSLPETPESWSWSALYRPAGEVGGDFYDYCERGGRVDWFIADICGKGVPGALIAGMLKGLLKCLFSLDLSPRQLVLRVNAMLLGELPKGMFLTALALRAESDGRLKYANASHTLCFLLRKSDRGYCLEGLPPSGVALGFMHEENFTRELVEVDLKLSPGDLLVIYTDGLTDARNRRRELFGEPRLREFLQDRHFESPSELTITLCEELEKYQKGCSQYDDITLIVGAYSG